MDGKEKLIYLLEEYYKDNYSTDTFADEFSRIYNFETDDSSLSISENYIMNELSVITNRFSPFEEDLKIPHMYFSGDDVKKKATEVYLKLIN
jgi:hypothetical protein